MDATKFRQVIRRMGSTLSFAWLQMKPELLQTYHQLAIDSSPKLRGIRAPLDEPVHDLVMGTKIRPGEMQSYLLNTVVPINLVAIQSIAEDVLERTIGTSLGAFRRIEALAAAGRINRGLASDAHHWRMARNVIAHATGDIDQVTENEAIDLSSKGLILFTQFKVWGPLVDAGNGGSLVPIIERAATNPAAGPSTIDIIRGRRLEIGVGDLLVAGEVWASIIEAAV